MEPIALFSVVALAGLTLRLLAGGLDGGRIETYLREQGWTPVDRHWEPFGPGWFGEKDARIYWVSYRDEDGSLYEAHAKTSMLSGVYLTDQRIVRAAQGAAVTPATTIEQENEALKRRIKELESRG